MESFWGTLKNELVHHRRYATRAEAQASIQEYIEIFITDSGAIPASDLFRRRCSLKNSAKSRRRFETTVSAIDSTPQKRLTDSGALRVDGDLARLGDWFGMVHDPIVDRTA